MPSPSLDPTAATPEGVVAAVRASTVTFYGGFVIVEADVGREGTSGWHVGSAGVEILREPSDQQLGEAVLRALSSSYKDKANDPIRLAQKKDLKDEMQAVGAPSVKALINGSQVIGVQQMRRKLLRRPKILLYPSRTVRNEGHSMHEDRELVLVDRSPAGMGRGAREARALCS